jgi:hypothetical protein
MQGKSGVQCGSRIRAADVRAVLSKEMGIKVIQFLMSL